MTFDRTLTIISVVLAALAAIAATVQSYVSWDGRRDFLTATALSQVVKGCHDVAYDARSIVLAKDPITREAENRLYASAAALDVVVDAIFPGDHFQIQTELSSFLSDSLQAPLNANDRTIQDVRVRFLTTLGLKCRDIIRAFPEKAESGIPTPARI
jgi:hypothetical protein